MLSNNEVTEGLLIAVLGANFVWLFFIAWHVLTACLYFRRVRRLAIAITGKMHCEELIDGLLSAQGTGDEAPSEKPLATTYLQSQKEPDRVQKHRERLALVAAGGQAGRYGLLAHGKALTDSHIAELDDSEIERLYACYEARLGAAMTKTLGSAALQLYAEVVSLFLLIPAENQPRLIADLEGDPFVEHALSSATCELYLRERKYRRPEHSHNWIPWIIGAPCLAGGSFAYVFMSGNMRPTSEAAGPAPKIKDKPPQLKACPDPYYMP